MLQEIELILGEDTTSLLSHKCCVSKDLLAPITPNIVDQNFALSDRNPRVLQSLQRMYDHGRLGSTGYMSILPVDQGIEQLILDLERLELNDIKFKQRDFYRLQQAEHLYRTDQIDERLNIKFK